MEFINKIINASNSNDINALTALFKNSNFNVDVDANENIIAHKPSVNADKKIMVCVVSQNTGVCIKGIKDKIATFVYDDDANKSILTDKEVFLNDTSAGIIRSTFKDEKICEQKLHLWDDNIIKIGDFVTIKNSALRKGDKLYGFNISQIIPLKIAIFVEQNLDNAVKDIYFTISKSEKSARAITNKISPDKIILIYTANTTEDFKISKGCGAVYKDGCAVIDKKMRELITETAESINISFQSFVGKVTPLTEILGITGKGADVGAICIPLDNADTSLTVADINDIEQAEKLLIKILQTI